MARAALLALACASVAAAARYADYAGAKMPQYGSAEYGGARDPPDAPDGLAPADDYHGHSPDASASLDYKFDEDTHVELAGKTERPLKESDERESWSKYARRPRVLDRMHDDGNLETSKYDPESENISKLKLNRRLPTHHPRQKKGRKESPHERPVKYKRGRNERPDPDRDYYQRSRGDTHRGGRNDIDGVDSYRHTKATERIIRRKQRDRHMRGRLEDDREMNEDAPQPSRRMNLERMTEADYGLRDEERERMNELEPYRPVLEEGDDAEPASTRRHKAYDNYGDYYDMKRLHNIRSKLPTLLRRTTARVAPPTATGSDVLALWTHRRAVPAAPPVPPAPLAPPAPRGPPAPPARDAAALPVVPLPPFSTVASSAATTAATTASASRTTTPASAAPANASEEISLAEKSRLSILKKAQRKESERSESSTAKPPVLLQVTDKRLTVVMVEPPSSEGPWQRAREVPHDTPDRVDRAKRLMRRKLVARARNIQELTDNWDELVCDYIDVALLDAAPPPRLPAPPLLLLLLPLLPLAM